MAPIPSIRGPSAIATRTRVAREPVSWSPAALAERVRLAALCRRAGRRMPAAVGAAVVVAGVAFWLLRTPSPPTEAGLPFATTRGGDDRQHRQLGAGRRPPATRSHADAPAVARGARHRCGRGARRLRAACSASRVGDAIAAAGGARADAAADALNLAAPVADGDRIDVPTVGELTPRRSRRWRRERCTPSSARAGSPAVDRLGRPPTELEALPGIGPATAAAIVDVPRPSTGRSARWTSWRTSPASGRRSSPRSTAWCRCDRRRGGSAHRGQARPIRARATPTHTPAASQR